LHDPPLRDERPVVDAERGVRRGLAYLAELNEPAPPATSEIAADKSIAAWQLAAIAPIGPLDRLALLREDDPDQRVGQLIALVEQANDVLAQRLAGG
jgi:hypothetical protein